ncbi:hypothetical protein [Lactobacillus corticis]|uniref:Uncharacterized protein n=1 Tax=Lactobacillus corticis TaxID=2201249 RepID=A0A916QJK8_9LACO|nr:hypothetical protein [Lactobacillus corticis]GFZ26485.1 hypothetical protein LCB40_03650 [Lactobacillus corticis]
MLKNYQKEIIWLRIAGWGYLLPAIAGLLLWKYFHMGVFLLQIGIAVVVGAYVLSTTTAERWRNPKNVSILAWITLFLISALNSIPLFIAAHYAKRIHE